MRRCGKFFRVAAKCILKRGHKSPHRSGFEKKQDVFYRLLSELMTAVFRPSKIAKGKKR